MATGAGNRNGVQKAPNLRSSSSFKSKLPPPNVRRSVAGERGSGADSGELLVYLLSFVLFPARSDCCWIGGSCLLLDCFCWLLVLILSSFSNVICCVGFCHCRLD